MIRVSAATVAALGLVAGIALAQPPKGGGEGGRPAGPRAKDPGAGGGRREGARPDAGGPKVPGRPGGALGPGRPGVRPGDGNRPGEGGRPAEGGRPFDGDRPGAESGDRRPEILRRFDRNGDGRFSEEELNALVEEMKRRGLSKEEIAQQLERIKRAEEAAAAKKAAGSGEGTPSDEPKKKPGTRKQKEILEKYDADGDGKLSASERAKIQQDLKAEKEDAARRKAEELKQHDTDGDGKLSPAERRAMEQEKRKARDAAKNG
jgi:Ca2+-binding EF-hand superfamily protein